MCIRDRLWDEQTVRKVLFYDNEAPIMQNPFAHGMENLNFDQCFTYIQDGFHHLKELTQHAAYQNISQRDYLGDNPLALPNMQNESADLIDFNQQQPLYDELINYPQQQPYDETMNYP